MPSLKARRGFTLIEFVVGIVLLAIALTGILGLLINQAPQAVDPVQQVRGAQLAQRILSEVLQKSFDEHSDHNGGRFRCGETVGTPAVTYPPCTASADYGPEGGETRPYAFNDVDDFDTGGHWVDARSIATIRSGSPSPRIPCLAAPGQGPSLSASASP